MSAAGAEAIVALAYGPSSKRLSLAGAIQPIRDWAPSAPPSPLAVLRHHDTE